MRRRTFLGISLTALAAWLSRRSGAQPAAAPRVRFGLVADLHYADTDDRGGRRFRAAAGRLEELVRRWNADPPDFLIELGDFKDQDPAPEPARTRAFLDRVEAVFRGFRGPVYHVLGNHDTDSLTRGEFLGAVRNAGQPAEARYSFDAGGAHFIVLDGNWRSDGQPYNRGDFDWKDTRLPDAQLRWLAAELAASAGPVIVFCHQRLDLDGDPHTARNAADARRILEACGRVVAVFQGHDHRGDTRTVNGIVYYTLKALVEAADGESCSATAVYRDGRLTVTGAAVVALPAPARP